MRYTLILLIVLSNGLFATAQTPLTSNKYFDVHLSEEFKKEKFPYSMVYGGSPFKFFGENAISFHQADRKKSIYGKYDFNLNRTVYNVVPHNLDDKELEVELTVQMGDEIREYVNIFNGREKTQSLYWRSLDPETLKPSKSKTKVISRSGKNYNRWGYAIHHAYSLDKKKLVIMTPVSKKEGGGTRFEVFDENFELLWDTIPPFSISEAEDIGLTINGSLNNDLINVRISNQGEVYCTGGQSRSDNWRDGLDYSFVRITREEITYCKIDDGSNKLDPPFVYLVEGEVPIAIGFYDDIPKDDHPRDNGYYIAKPDFESGTTSVQLYEFSQDFVRQFRSEYWVEKDKEDMAKGEPGGYIMLYFKNIVPNAEGGFTLVVQEGEGGNVVVIDLNANGVANWASKIPFAQSGIGKQYMGFGLGQTEDRLYFLFNDHAKNASPDWDMKKLHTFDQFNRKIPHVATIAICDRTDEGNIIRKQAWAPKEVGGIISPINKSIQIGNSLFVHLADKGSKERVIEIKLK